MNRLSVQLTLAMLLVAAVSFVAIPVAETIASRVTFASLPTAFRKQVIDRTTPHLFFRGPPPPGQRDGGRPLRPPADAGTTSGASTGGATAADGTGAASGASAGGAASSGPSDTSTGGPPGNTPGSTPGDTADATTDQSLATQNERLFELLGSFRAAQQRAVLLGIAAALLLGVALALALSRNIAVPIEALARAARHIAKGDFGTRMSLRRGPLQTREARQLTEDFNAMAGALESYERERKAMVADIAHELRTPLASMQMRLDAIRDELVPWTDREADLLQQHLRQLARLVDDLRFLSLADAGRLSLRMEDIELREWLDGVAEALHDVARRRGCRLALEAPSDALHVRADGDRLYQVLRNLVDNASEAMEGGGTVRLSLGREGDDAVWRVRDEGPGIDPEQLDSIFERFSHGRRRDTQSAGRGLGLAIVRTLVTLHGGTVAAANLDHGAEFTVRLPARTA